MRGSVWNEWDDGWNEKKNRNGKTEKLFGGERTYASLLFRLMFALSVNSHICFWIIAPNKKQNSLKMYSTKRETTYILSSVIHCLTIWQVHWYVGIHQWYERLEVLPPVHRPWTSRFIRPVPKHIYTVPQTLLLKVFFVESNWLCKRNISHPNVRYWCVGYCESHWKKSN